MVKLVDMPDLGSGAARRVGSSPIIRTFQTQIFVNKGFAFFAFNTCQTFAKHLQSRSNEVIYKISFESFSYLQSSPRFVKTLLYLLTTLTTEMHSE